MSVTAPPQPPAPTRVRADVGGVVGGVAVVALVVTLAAQISYPLIDDPPTVADNQTLLRVTWVTVVAMATASVASFAGVAGWRTAAVGASLAALVAAGAEISSVATGFPFGFYDYSTTLGPHIAGMPWVIPVAWLMMTWPALCAGLAGAGLLRPEGQRSKWWRCVLAWALATATLAGWDFYLDPQMVGAGHWQWHDLASTPPGLANIPWSNFGGWYLTSGVIFAILVPLYVRTASHRSRGGVSVPLVVTWVLLGWTVCGSALANVVWFGSPVVAAWGLPAMGVPVAIAAWLAARRMFQQRQDDAS